MYQLKILVVLGDLKQILDEHTRLIGDLLKPQLKLRSSYLSTQETLARINRTEKTLYNWINKGIIKALKIGGNNYFLESDVSGLINRK